MTAGTDPNWATWPIPKLLSELKEAYKNEGIGDVWASEEEPMRSRLESLRTRLSGRYKNPTTLGVGGSGVVLKLSDDQLSDKPVALKFPRPVQGQADALADLLGKEVQHLVELRHSSIVRIHSFGTTAESGKKFVPFPYFVMDFVDGAKSNRFLENVALDDAGFYDFLYRTVDAIAYLHSTSTVHMDVKPDNVMVNKSGVPVITDLGTAKKLSDSTETTLIALTRQFASPEAIQRIDKNPSDPNRTKGWVPKNELRLEWDLPPLGRTILIWLGYGLDGSPTPRAHKLSPYCRKYVLLLAARCLRSAVPPWLENRVGLDRRLLMDTQYESLQQVLNDIGKVSGRRSLAEMVPELNPYHPETLQVAAGAPTTYTRRLKTLVECSSVRRLAAISQLGVVSQVYPTATHSRLEHSIGTYHKVCQVVSSLYYDPFSPLFRQLMETQDVCSVLVAAVLHDIGQFPLAHDLEEIAPLTFDHRRLGDNLIATLSQDPDSEFSKALSLWGITGEQVLKVLRAKLQSSDGSIKERLLRSIIDGPLDADKLDYLQRDTDRLKVPYANGIDIDRILRSLTVIVTNRGYDGLACVGVHEKARVSAEFVVIARYALFAQAYWHHSVRSMKAMLGRSVQALLASLTSGAGTQTAWREKFEEFVTDLPGALYSESSEERPTLPALAKQVLAEADTSTLSACDAAVIGFLLAECSRLKLPEAELLSDLLHRRIYKRVFVFSPDRSAEVWRLFTEQWEPLQLANKLDFYSKLETWLLKQCRELRDRAAAHTSFDVEDIDRLIARLEERRPTLLIDIPGSRPGSEVALHFVVEAQRRSLRKDERAIGEAQASAVWSQFGTGLRERAGKLRVYAPEVHIDVVEAAMARDAFAKHAEKLLQAY